MDLISKRWRKPKGRPSKRRKANAENSRKRGAKENPGCIPNAFELEEETATQPEASYIITHKSVFDELLGGVPCKTCKEHSLGVFQKHSKGYSVKLELLCRNCGEVYSSVFSSPTEGKDPHEINSKIASAFLAIGRGHAALETFSSMLNMPTMDRKTFSKCLLNLHVKSCDLKEKMLRVSREAARVAHLKMDGDEQCPDTLLDVSVSYDGSWQKRGHTSNLGLGIIIDIVSGLVLDYEVLSKYCHECVMTGNELGIDSPEFCFWKEGHASVCEKNFDGSSGAMEMHAALIMWKRSISDCNMRYVSVLSDGDSKTFQFLNESQVYGPDFQIEKEECLNHVAKRLGTSLRNKVKEWRVKKITLGGKKKGSLTEKNITKLQNFYRKAIKDNAPDIVKMKNAIFASLKHCSSTDSKPQHNNCPSGESSWCFFQRALAKGERPDSHSRMKTFLTQQVVEKIMPVYQRLASECILSRCIAGKTQNANESLHSCIWRKCPKEVFVSRRRLEIAVTDAVEKHNLGYVQSLESTDPLDDSFSLTLAKRRDQRRLGQKKSVKKPRKKCAKRDDSYCAGGF